MLKNIIAIDPVADKLLQRKNSGEDPYLLFLGAGASISSGIPGMPKLIEEFLIDQSLTKIKLKKMDSPQRLDQFFEYIKKESPSTRYDWLYHLFKDAEPSQGYDALAKLVEKGYFDVILSTNVDNLLEKAVNDNSKISSIDFSVWINGIDRIETIEKFLLYKSPRIKLIKLHGDLDSRNLLFTPSEIFQFQAALETVLTKLFKTRDMIMLGYNLADIDILRCLTRNERSLIFVNPNPPNNPEIVAALDSFQSSFFMQGDAGRFDDFFAGLLRILG